MHLHLLHSYGLEGSKAMDTDCCVELLVALECERSTSLEPWIYHDTIKSQRIKR